MNNFMNGMFGKVAPGLCRLSMSGKIAIRTDGGEYKSYNMKTGRFTNCNNFVFDIGDDFFFVIPTNKVAIGDIILVGGNPMCVIKIEKNCLEVISYKDGEVKKILPERHMFMGNAYFYGKIVSMFGSDIMKGKGKNNIFKYMMLSEMMKGNGGGGFSSNSMGNMLPLMMLSGGGFDNMFSGMFDGELFGGDDIIEEDEEDVDNDNDEDEEE